MEELDNAVDDAANCTVDFCYRVSNVPESYQDAISSPESSKWRDAMNKELDALWVMKYLNSLLYQRVEPQWGESGSMQ